MPVIAAYAAGIRNGSVMVMGASVIVPAAVARMQIIRCRRASVWF
jgi:hypothetical protein